MYNIYIYDDDIVYNMLINNACGEAPRGHSATHGARVVYWSHSGGGGATGRARPVDVGRSPGRKLLDIILLWFYIIMVLCVVQYSAIVTLCSIVLRTGNDYAAAPRWCAFR